MNKKQWDALGSGSIIFGILLLFIANILSCNVADSNLFVACYIRRYAYAIPGLTFIAFGMVSYILAWLEPKRKEN